MVINSCRIQSNSSPIFGYRRLFGFIHLLGLGTDRRGPEDGVTQSAPGGLSVRPRRDGPSSVVERPRRREEDLLEKKRSGRGRK